MIRTIMNKYPYLSLKKVAEEVGVNYIVLLKKAKSPVPGETYSPDTTNYDAIQRYLDSKGVDLAVHDWEALNVAPARSCKNIKDPNLVEVGNKVYLRCEFETPFEVIYKTETHIVLMLQGSTMPRAMKLETFIAQGPRWGPRIY